MNYDSLIPLLSSEKGLHLSIYLPISGSSQAKRRLELAEQIEDARSFLLAECEDEGQRGAHQLATEKFLAPVIKFQNEFLLTTHVKGNLALFRTWDAFRVLVVPVPVRPSCFLAESFHIKPLLRWLQESKGHSQKAVAKALAELEEASRSGEARRNIFQIARAAVEGRVRKLLIAGDIHIFGKLDKSSGGIALHPLQLDSKDDDLLDDLAQEVLRHGGQVVVADLKAIPKNRPALAIVRSQSSPRSRHENRLASA